MRRILFLLAGLAVALCAVDATAARVVVLGVDSGADITAPYDATQPPNLPSLPAGAKGFLIGIDLQDNLQDFSLGVQNLRFTNVIHQQGQLDNLGNPLPQPANLTTRSLAQSAEAKDGVLNNGYLRSDTYLMDNPQQGSAVWTPVGPGIVGGAPGDTFFRVTATLGTPANIDGPGPVQFVYVVAAGDVEITGLIARGQSGFNPMGGTDGVGALLDFATGGLFQFAPSTKWSNPAGGTFGVSSNWSFGVPGAQRRAVFDRPETYTVSFAGGATSAFLQTEAGDVTFDLNGFTYALVPIDEGPGPGHGPSVTVGPASHLRLTDGHLATADTAIGGGIATIGMGATWSESADFAIGSNGELHVEDGGSMTVAGSLTADTGSVLRIALGTVAANQVELTGTPTLQIGLGGTGAGEIGQLLVTGQATLGGTFDVDLLDGFAPALGDSFSVITFGTRVGDFIDYTGLGVGGHLALQHSFTATSLVLKARPALDGDINLDGTVDIFDINEVSAHWSSAGPQGDANGDGTVDIFDINAISANWGATDPGGAQAVPEPASIVLLCLGALAIMALARRRSVL